MTSPIRARIPIGLCAADADDVCRAVKTWVPAPANDIDWRLCCPFIANASAVSPVSPDWCGLILAISEPDAGMAHWLRADNTRQNGFWSLMPIETIESLRDASMRENFLLRVLTFYRWRRLLASGLNVSALQQFYACHKYLVMSRDISAYRRLGSLLARSATRPLPETADAMIGLMMAALARPQTRAGNANALLHIRGYLKRRLDRGGQSELSGAIERYRLGEIPLSEPLNLLQGYFRVHPDAYIAQQVFLQPDRWAAFFDSDEL